MLKNARSTEDSEQADPELSMKDFRPVMVTSPPRLEDHNDGDGYDRTRSWVRLGILGLRVFARFDGSFDLWAPLTLNEP